MEDLLDTWLSLNEYSNKYQVSLSTLRRRIKSDRVKFSFRHGKYFLKDVSLQDCNSISSPHTQKPSALKPKGREVLINKAFAVQQKEVLSQSDLSAYSFFNIDKNLAETNTDSQTNTDSHSVLTSHKSVEPDQNLQLPPLQTDYELIIKTQKAQIIKLQTELADLETLVMVLEK